MDYRYETKNEARSFHKMRKAFVIIDGALEFLEEGSSMSHFEYCSSKGISKENFNKLTRGFYLDGKLISYKENFIYDENVINELLFHIDEISKKIKADVFDIYFGQLPENNFAPNYYYGKYEKGKIISR